MGLRHRVGVWGIGFRNLGFSFFCETRHGEFCRDLGIQNLGFSSPIIIEKETITSPVPPPRLAFSMHSKAHGKNLGPCAWSGGLGKIPERPLLLCAGRVTAPFQTEPPAPIGRKNSTSGRRLLAFWDSFGGFGVSGIWADLGSGLGFRV